MAYSSDPHQKRSFVPAQNQQENLVMRRAEDLYRAASKRGQACFSGFLSDRQQELARAALEKLGCDFYHFDGGYPEAQRQVLVVDPEEGSAPICFLKIESTAFAQQKLSHQDYLGALLGLSVERECLGDILLLPGQPQVAYAAVLERMADFLARELTQVGRDPVRVMVCDRSQVEWQEMPTPEIRTATVSSLRLDSLLAAMLNTSRAQASALIREGRVEIGHIPQTNAHAAVYEGDVFSVRGKGKFQLKTVGGRSRKDRIFIEFFQY